MSIVSEERLAEVRSLIGDIGVDATAEKTGLKRETVRRYNRKFPRDNKANDKQVDDLPADNLAAKLVQAFSQAELKALLDDSRTLHPEHRRSECNFSGEWFKFGVISDTHLGSQYTNDEEVYAVLEELNKAGCKELLIAGDLTEGMSGRNGHLYELRHPGYRRQRNVAVDVFSTFNGKVRAISGNHDLWYFNKGDTGALIVEDICKSLPDGEYLGEHEGSIFFNGARVDLWHGIDGASYALSYRMQKIVESLGEDKLPQMIIAGHDHKAEFIPNLRGVFALEAGCLQHQTPFMRMKKLRAMTGFWQIEICVRDARIIKVRQEWTKL